MNPSPNEHILPRGTGIALVTPFDSKGRPDRKGLQRLVDHVVQSGVEFIVALGTTAETPTLSKEDRIEVLEMVKESLAGRKPLWCGMGGNDTRELLEQKAAFDLHGVDALLSVTPYYNRPSQAGLYAHYRELALSTDKPIVLYNVPARTGCSLSSETTLRLAHDFKNIVATKEASGDWLQIMEIMRSKPNSFKVYSGDDAISLPLLSLGLDGVVSVVGNAWPQAFGQMVRYALSGNYPDARRLHYQLLPLMTAVFREGSPAGIKFILQNMGICEDHLRLPLVSVSRNLQTELKDLMLRFEKES
ncbi:MAG: 4-hydroxy-tetrahydrodipicolinate synthase [Cytophagia bacterium]|nr:4-hydroxy-tetrahydrodipicolinate synthase [Cytophagia bacterium]